VENAPLHIVIGNHTSFQSLKDIRYLKMFDLVALWAFAQVMKLVINIQQTSHIISNITLRQGPIGTSIPKGLHGILPGQFALTQLEIFTLK
jgi:hypothetical protein